MGSSGRTSSFARFFDLGPARRTGTAPLVHASAPGRLDVMGGIADYSGSLVLQMPIGNCTTATLRKRRDGVLRIYSASTTRVGRGSEVTLRLADLTGPRKATDGRLSADDFAQARRVLAKTPGGDWAAYVAGCFLVLARAKALPPAGADVYIDSTVPSGKGVSSSAAIEVATMVAIGRAWKLRFQPTELPILAQQVENLIVGAPCGLMDQLASYLGRENRLLPILCQPDQVGTPLTIPKGVRFVGIDSGVRHAVSGASYGQVRCAAFMGYSLIARALGVPAGALKAARNRGRRNGLPYGGYLANIPPSVYAQQFRRILPATMTGTAFVREAGATIDAITAPEPRVKYAVEACAAHPVYECDRVKQFALHLQALQRITPGGTRLERGALLQALGELMFQSHASYGNCGLGEPATDAIVAAVREAGTGKGVYGAKITGGGSGGTVCVLCDGRPGVATAEKIAAQAGRRAHKKLAVFEYSSEGARFRTW